ncbi:MAG: SpoIIIAH-like family protein [Lachnospiraceae bacterium]|nr:SpoIIIAH-like family protein [Lachnospiraceae bacterium]
MKKLFKKNQIIITTLAIMIAIAGYLNYSGQLLEEEADTVSSGDNTVLLTDEIEENTYVDTYTDIVSLDGDGTETASVSEEGTAGLTGVTADEDSDSDANEEAADTAEADEERGTGSTQAAVGEAVLASAGVSDFSEILSAAKLNREQVRAKSKEELQELIDSTDVAEEQKEEAVTAMTALTLNAEKESAAELLLEASGYTDCVVSITDDTADVVINAAELTEAERAQIEDIVKRKTEVEGENIVITPAAASAAGENQSGEDASKASADENLSEETTDGTDTESNADEIE